MENCQLYTSKDKELEDWPELNKCHLERRRNVSESTPAGDEKVRSKRSAGQTTQENEVNGIGEAVTREGESDTFTSVCESFQQCYSFKVRQLSCIGV